MIVSTHISLFNNVLKNQAPFIKIHASKGFYVISKAQKALNINKDPNSQ